VRGDCGNRDRDCSPRKDCQPAPGLIPAHIDRADPAGARCGAVAPGRGAARRCCHTTVARPIWRAAPTVIAR
jgi:hypothetical protein